MEQRNFINSEIIKPSLITSEKLSFTRIMLVLGAIASVSVAIPVTMSLISHK